MAPLILLITSFLAIYLFIRISGREHFTKSFMGRASMAFMLVFTGIAHFTNTEEMIAMLPQNIPLKSEIVYATGFLELLAVIGLLFQKTSRITSIFLILFFICVLPANIIGSIKEVELGGMDRGPAYLYFRIPLQLFFAGWVYYFGLSLNKSKV